MIVTLPPPNALMIAFEAWSRAVRFEARTVTHSYSAFCTNRVACGNSAVADVIRMRATRRHI
jgi:hypothetical protein